MKRTPWWRRIFATPAQRWLDAEIDRLADMWERMTPEERQRVARTWREAYDATCVTAAELSTAFNQLRGIV